MTLTAKTARAAIDEKNLRDELKKADEKHQEDKNNCAVIQGQESAVKQQIEKDEKELKRLNRRIEAIKEVYANHLSFEQHFSDINYI